MVLPEGSLHACGPHQVWLLRSECCGRGVPKKVVCAECMKMCCLGGKNSVVKGLTLLSSMHAHVETARKARNTKAKKKNIYIYTYIYIYLFIFYLFFSAKKL